MESFYSILGVNSSATLEEIKKQYRKKAKLLHPDVNKAPNAEDEFIQLNKAYIFLVDYKLGKNNIQKNKPSRKYSRTDIHNFSKYYANQSYKTFVKSEYYKAMNSFNSIYQHFAFVFSVLFMIILPLVFLILQNYVWAIVVGGFALLSAPYTIPEMRNFKRLDWTEFFRSIAFFLSYRSVALVLLTFINVFLFLRIGLMTLIPTNQLLLFYILVAIILFVFSRLMGKSFFLKYSKLLSFGYYPLIINLLLLVNYVFAQHPSTERYFFSNSQANAKGYSESSTLIHLQGNIYSQYWGIRLFSDIEQMQGKYIIIYEFQEGALGFRVMKGYAFRRNE